MSEPNVDSRHREGKPLLRCDLTAKGSGKSVVAVAHQKLRSKSTADALKKTWTENLDRLGQVVAYTGHEVQAFSLHLSVRSVSLRQQRQR